MRCGRRVLEVIQDPILRLDGEPTAPLLGGSHHQHLADGQRAEIIVGQLFGFFGEIIDQFIIQTDQTVLLQKADRQRNKTFGRRIHPMLKILMKGLPIMFKENLIFPHNDQIVGCQL